MTMKRTKPAPIKPRKHQLISMKHDATTPFVFDCSDPGTGKTFVRVVTFAERRRKGGGCMLVLAPRTLLRTVWETEIRKYAPDMKVSVATASNRAKAFAEPADIYITNIDGIKWVAQQKRNVTDKFSELVIDESSFYKHHTSQRSRAAAKVSKLPNFKKKACLTGTPNGRTICDVWHQVYLLDGGKRLGNSFYAFRNSVCQPKQVGPKPEMVEWADKEGAEEAVFNVLGDITIRHRFEDCVDIPAMNEYTVPYFLTDKQKRTYMEMELLSVADVLGSNKRVSSLNAASKATKLLQISSGAVYSEDGRFVVIDEDRYDMILDMCEERVHPLVMFFWKHQRQMLTERAAARKKTFAVIDGDTKDRERLEIEHRYQQGELDILFGHPKSVAYGLTLTRGTSVIWPCPTYNQEWMAQGRKRQNRIGQTKKTENVIVVAEGTIEEYVYENCMKKGARMDNLLRLFELLKERV